jgi:hypothetical protein
MSGLPITTLDFTDFTSLTDEGARYIASFTRLRYLSLKRTSVSETGLGYLDGASVTLVLILGLTRLTELYLDRTNITDHIVPCLLGIYNTAI